MVTPTNRGVSKPDVEVINAAVNVSAVYKADAGYVEVIRGDGEWSTTYAADREAIVTVIANDPVIPVSQADFNHNNLTPETVGTFKAKAAGSNQGGSTPWINWLISNRYEQFNIRPPSVSNVEIPVFRLDVNNPRDIMPELRQRLNDANLSLDEEQFMHIVIRRLGEDQFDLAIWPSRAAEGTNFPDPYSLRNGGHIQLAQLMLARTPGTPNDVFWGGAVFVNSQGHVISANDPRTGNIVDALNPITRSSINLDNEIALDLNFDKSLKGQALEDFRALVSGALTPDNIQYVMVDNIHDEIAQGLGEWSSFPTQRQQAMEILANKPASELDSPEFNQYLEEIYPLTFDEVRVDRFIENLYQTEEDSRHSVRC